MAKKRGGKKWWKKSSAKFTAIGLGIVAAAIGYYFYTKNSGSVGRLGIYIPEPKVTKYVETGIKYYS